ncbi:MAG: hypothetical protein JSS75_07950 [Bacteroidetes bacterium]|nr:hypothetical protein [Bacteroidota bacterium]
MTIPIQAAPVLRGSAGMYATDASVTASDYSTCVSATVNNGKLCFSLPVIGSICIPVPSWVPSGASAQACANICTHIGIPTGASATVTVLGKQIWSDSVGWC